MKIEINAAQLANELDELASAFSATELPAVTRIVFSQQDLAARRWFKSLCTAAGLSIREDAVGNTFVRWHGSDRTAAAVGTGSHIDAIPHSGRFDGTVGVLGGLEAIRALQRAGFQPRRSIEVLLFTSEEPTRFGIGCLGSRLLVKSTSASAGETLRDSEGRTLNEVRTAAGFTGSLDSVPLEPGYYHAFAELHIEQGPLLEQRNVPLGVVRAIAAPASLRVTIEGQGGHAGAVLMPDRHDAFLAAAEIALAVELAARSTGAIDTVATTGMCEVFPGNINAVPSRVRISFDIRDTDEARRDSVLQSLEQACKDTEDRRGVTTIIEPINRDAPCVCGPAVVEALTNACEKHNLAFDTMVSRAYHDSLFMSRICPTAMLFIPCRNGVSHRPDEYSSPEDIARGTLILAEALATLSA